MFSDQPDLTNLNLDFFYLSAKIFTIKGPLDK